MRAIVEENPVSFREVVFEDVYPLYGQIDIKGSSDARNHAIQKDLVLQLRGISKSNQQGNRNGSVTYL